MISSNTANGEFRIGSKNLYDLCPSKVRENLTNATKTKNWDGPHKKATAEISRKINEFEAQNSGEFHVTNLNFSLVRICLCTVYIHISLKSFY